MMNQIFTWEMVASSNIHLKIESLGLPGRSNGFLKIDVLLSENRNLGIRIAKKIAPLLSFEIIFRETEHWNKWWLEDDIFPLGV